MVLLPKTVDVHEKTVQRVAEEDPFEPFPKVKPKRKYTRKATSAVKRTHWTDGLDPRIVAWVKKNYPKIDTRRIQVFPPEAVVIHNNPYGLANKR